MTDTVTNMSANKTKLFRNDIIKLHPMSFHSYNGIEIVRKLRKKADSVESLSREDNVRLKLQLFGDFSASISNLENVRS